MIIYCDGFLSSSVQSRLLFQDTSQTIFRTQQSHVSPFPLLATWVSLQSSPVAAPFLGHNVDVLHNSVVPSQPRFLHQRWVSLESSPVQYETWPFTDSIMSIQEKSRETWSPGTIALVTTNEGDRGLSPRGNETRQVVGRPYAATSMHLNWLRLHSSCRGSLPPLIARTLRGKCCSILCTFLHVPPRCIPWPFRSADPEIVAVSSFNPSSTAAIVERR